MLSLYFTILAVALNFIFYLCLSNIYNARHIQKRTDSPRILNDYCGSTSPNCGYYDIYPGYN
jgi:hypothetical protein